MKKFHFFRGLEEEHIWINEQKLIMCHGGTYYNFESDLAICMLTEIMSSPILEELREPGNDIKSRRNFTKRPTQIKIQPRRNNFNYNRIRSNIKRR